MPLITFPDGRNKNYENGVTGIDIAGDISISLKKAIAILVNDQEKDLLDPIEEDSVISIITIKDDIGLDIMRHTLTAQVLAKAVKIYIPLLNLRLVQQLRMGFTMMFYSKSQYLSKIFQQLKKR